MQQLFNKNIIVGVTGSIAAYKAADLVRRLRDAGAQVRVIMTAAACEFVTPLTFQAVSGNEVHRELLDESTEGGMGHIQLARWADLILVAPASANIIATLANGKAPDLLTTVCLASSAPIAVAPAMNQQMWLQVATADNVGQLVARGVHILGPDSGDQACGDIGPGRMLEVIELVKQAADIFQNGVLSGKTVVITAGPTQEAIDPVRYISNRSSGKMGYAIAQAVVEAGAKCILISGPVNLTTPPKVQRLDVKSTIEMHSKTLELIEDCDVFIASAAVSDYRPIQMATQKLKKTNDNLVLELTRNPDILADVSAQYPHIFCVGFAAETENLEQYALSKLQQKSLNLIVANEVGKPGSGFESGENALTVFWENGKQEFPLASKTSLAQQLVSLIAKRQQKN